MTDMMIDLETLGHRADAVITQIGFAAFDRDGDDTLEFGTIYVDPQSCLEAGLRVDASTILWWLGQDDDARQIMVNPPAEVMGVWTALDRLSSTIGRITPDRIWACPPQFDLSILKSAYFATGSASVPWDFRSERCLRTLCDLVGYDRKRGPQPKIRHQAGEDARCQAIQCQLALATLQGVLT